MQFLKDLIKNNTGISCKNFFVITLTISGFLLLLVPVILLPADLFINKHLTIKLGDVSLYIGAVGTLFVTAGVTKIWGEKYEKDERIEKLKQDGKNSSDKSIDINV